MSSADQLGNAETELRSAASSYGTIAGELAGLVVNLSAIVGNVLTTWQGLGSEAFATAQKQAARDGYRVIGALNGAAQAMIAQADNIQANVEPISIAQHTEIDSIDPVEIRTAEQAATTARSAISTLAVSLSGGLASEVLPLVTGACSTGTEPLAPGLVDGVTVMVPAVGPGTPPSSGSSAVPGSGSPTPGVGGTGGPGGGSPPPTRTGSSGCSVPSWQDIQTAINSFRANPASALQSISKGVALTAGGAIVIGGANSTYAALSYINGKQTINSALGQAAGNVFGGILAPVNYALATLASNCVPQVGSLHNAMGDKFYYSISGSLLGGIVEGGVVNYYALTPVINSLIPPSSATPAPTTPPAPTTAPAPTVTPIPSPHS